MYKHMTQFLGRELGLCTHNEFEGHQTKWFLRSLYWMNQKWNSVVILFTWQDLSMLLHTIGSGSLNQRIPFNSCSSIVFAIDQTTPHKGSFLSFKVATLYAMKPCYKTTLAKFWINTTSTLHSDTMKKWWKCTLYFTQRYVCFNTHTKITFIHYSIT